MLAIEQQLLQEANKNKIDKAVWRLAFIRIKKLPPAESIAFIDRFFTSRGFKITANHYIKEK